MKTRLVTIKTTPQALKLLRQICALTSQKQYEVLERILLIELTKVQETEKNA